jgi:hypothetical protein
MARAEVTGEKAPFNSRNPALMLERQITESGDQATKEYLKEAV